MLLTGLIVGWFVGTVCGAIAMGLACGPRVTEPPRDVIPSPN